ncbi:MAG: hypothetical protein FJX67_07795 [Alphaproteobacteria bacterium]|nr:hypothetical protein [Alphaproteobacteria bacterium]
MLSVQEALIYTMVLMAAVDRDMSDIELDRIGDMAKHLPVFRDYDPDRLGATARTCAERVNAPDGIETVFAEIEGALPGHLRETAYALACDVAVADRRIPVEERRLLIFIRDRLGLSRLVAAAIEHAARVRFIQPPAPPRLPA